VQEATAIEDLKPSAIAQGKGIQYATALAQRGIGLGAILQAPYRWLSWSAASAFGLYGYLNVPAPFAIYVVLVTATFAITLLGCIGLVRCVPQQAARLITVGAGVALLVVESSLLNSWIIAFQAQGRYLFPIFVMLALLLATSSARVPQLAFRITIGVAALASSYSFLFVALRMLGHG
jgi:hypothetical protein